MHRTNCDLDNHAPDLFEIQVEDDGAYTVCCCCGAQLIADGPYTVAGGQPNQQFFRDGAVPAGVMAGGDIMIARGIVIDENGDAVALCKQPAVAQRIAALLNFAHPDTSDTP